MGALFSRVKTWSSTEDVVYSDLNSEFDNILNNLTAANVDDFSANASQMQTTADPGEVGTESLATSVAGEISRLRHLIKEITGEDEWYETPVSSLLGLANAIGSGLTANRLVSGRVRTNSAMPIFLVPNGAARTVKLDGTPTNFVYYVNSTEYTISSDVTLTSLTAAPSSNNTCLINDTTAADQFWTKYSGEDGSEIPVDTMGTEISALVGKFAAFKLDNGSTTEIFLAHVTSTTRLSKARRGYFFDSTDAEIPRIVYSNNDTITLLKLTWVFAKTDGTLTATYNNPTWSKDEPSSPSLGDYWFDQDNNTWKVRSVSTWDSAGAVLVGICCQDTTNTIGARSFDFFRAYDPTANMEIIAESNSAVKSRYQGSEVSVYGATVKGEFMLRTWDMTADLDSGVTENASTYYYFYLTEEGDQIISDMKPHDRREDLQGYYHPHQSWRCLGWAFNNASSNLEQIESYYHAREAEAIRTVLAADTLMVRDQIVKLTGASYTQMLPPAALTKGNVYTFIHGGTSLTQLYTLDGFSSETIGGATTYILATAGETLRLLSDGSNYLILAHFCDTVFTSYTPTGTNLGTLASVAMFWRRQGSNVIIQGSFVVGTTAAAAPAAFTLPTGIAMDPAQLPGDQLPTLGFVVGNVTTAGSTYPGTARGPWAITYDSATGASSVVITDTVDQDTALYDAARNASGFLTTGSSLSCHSFPIPVAGWNP